MNDAFDVMQEERERSQPARLIQVALLVCDHGDGSSGIRFFRDINLARQLASNGDNEEFFANEGEPVIIEVQDGFTPPGFFADDYY